MLTEREARAADLTRANQAMRHAIAGLASLSELDVFLTERDALVFGLPLQSELRPLL